MVKRRGRPPKPPEDVKIERIEFRATTNELQEFDQAAESAGLDRSEWIRDRLKAAAKRELKK